MPTSPSYTRKDYGGDRIAAVVLAATVQPTLRLIAWCLAVSGSEDELLLGGGGA